jgi:hypothetical protein
MVRLVRLGAMLAALVAACTPTHPRPPIELPVQMAADKTFDWDRYHDRRDACTELDELRRECAHDTRACNETASRRLARDCTPWRK